VDNARRVAEALCPTCEGPSQHWGFSMSHPCPDCEGTGRRWPWAQKKCPCLEGYTSTCCPTCLKYGSHAGTDGWCQACQGYGYTLPTEPEGTYWGLEWLGRYFVDGIVEIYFRYSNHPYWSIAKIIMDDEYRLEELAIGYTLRHAVYAAMLKEDNG